MSQLNDLIIQFKSQGYTLDQAQKLAVEKLYGQQHPEIPRIQTESYVMTPQGSQVSLQTEQKIAEYQDIIQMGGQQIQQALTQITGKDVVVLSPEQLSTGQPVLSPLQTFLAWSQTTIPAGSTLPGLPGPQGLLLKSTLPSDVAQTIYPGIPDLPGGIEIISTTVKETIERVVQLPGQVIEGFQGLGTWVLIALGLVALIVVSK